MQRHRFVSGCPAGRKTFAMWLISMVSMATILMESRDMVKTPFVFIVKYEGAGVKIAAARQHFCGPPFLLPCACAIMKYREAIGLPQGVLRGDAGLFPVPVICCMLVFVIELFV